MARQFALAAVLAAIAGLLAACSAEPQFVTFEYQRKVMSPGEQSAVSNALRSGSMTLRDFRGASSPTCQFAANVGATGTITGVDVSHDPNIRVSQITLDADNFLDGTRDPNSALDPGSQKCPRGVGGNEIATLKIETNADIKVGRPVVDSGAGEVFIDGQGFSSRGLYGKFNLTSFDDGYTVGSFEFLARNTDDLSDHTVLVVTNGNFGVDDQQPILRLLRKLRR
ncbi:MAG: hypothetical protein QNJ94_12195 [Alphaproteobacteria bacterium]|nr:hypothetical protein [Alphaproteobacteria bacterium]